MNYTPLVRSMKDLVKKIRIKTIRIRERAVNLCIKRLFITSTVVLYHRVADVTEDPLHLCIDSKILEEHFIFYKKFYEIISIEELIIRLEDKKLTGRELVITFDDGYEDNLTYALPLLQKYDIPATIFVTTSQIGQIAHHFWDKQYKEENKATFLNKNELKVLSKQPFIEIGAHTHTHPRLVKLSLDEQIEEMYKSKDSLEMITNKTITMFAYPFGGRGDMSSNSYLAAKKVGFRAAFTNTQRFVTVFSSPFSVPRFNIRSCSATELARQLMTKNYG